MATRTSRYAATGGVVGEVATTPVFAIPKPVASGRVARAARAERDFAERSRILAEAGRR